MSQLETEISGDLPQIIANDEKLYEGDLIYYFQVLFLKANNLYNPYHNFRHMSHVSGSATQPSGITRQATTASNAYPTYCCIIPRL